MLHGDSVETGLVMPEVKLKPVIVSDQSQQTPNLVTGAKRGKACKLCQARENAR